jgi:hypothetical protein
MSNAQTALTAQMLQWINTAAHTYKEALDVWRTSCPRLSIWEDACIEGLVDCAAGPGGVVFITEKGRRFMIEHSRH